MANHSLFPTAGAGREAHRGAVPNPALVKKKLRRGVSDGLPEAAQPRAPGAAQVASRWARSPGPLASPSLPGGRWVQAACVLADLSCVALSFAILLVACHALGWLRHLGLHDAGESAVVPREYSVFVFLYAVLVVLFAQACGLYGTARDRSANKELILVGKAVSCSTVVLMIAIYASGSHAISRLVIVGSALLTVMLLSCWRVGKRSLVERRIAAGIGVRNALIAGAGRIGKEIAEYLDRNKHLGIVVKGFLDHNHVGDPRVLGRIEDLAEIARAQFIDEIIITIPFMRRRVKEALVAARLHNIDVKIVPELYGSFVRGATLEYVGHVPVMNLRRPPIPALGLILKRTIDILGSAVGLVLLSPLLVAIAVAVKVDAPGPIFYRSLRLGKKGKAFTFYKFRTMIANAEQLKAAFQHLNQRQAVIFKIPDDPRITRLGRFLRRYSLDELPQLWNVLKGDMSLVGPRPPVPEECSRYKLEHFRRLDVTPGITGLWQIRGRRDPSFDKYVEFDLQYIERWSPWTDIKILLSTFLVVLQGQGQ